MDWFVVWFFVKRFFIGFMIGAFLRMIIAIMLRSDCSLKGFFNSGFISGIIYTSLYFYIIYTG